MHSKQILLYSITKIAYFTLFCWFLTACASLNKIDQVPNDHYKISAEDYKAEFNESAPFTPGRFIPITVESTDSSLLIIPRAGNEVAKEIALTDFKNIKFHRNTFDVDVLTIPFKIRPSVGDFPTQLNPNFSAALYLGRRHDEFRIKNVKHRRYNQVQQTGIGYGYGAFLGLGSVTMNSFVTKDNIDYEYEGLVINGGIATVYDAKKFNFGVSLGADILLDKNQHFWIYQGKPWLGVLFGINLN